MKVCQLPGVVARVKLASALTSVSLTVQAFRCFEQLVRSDYGRRKVYGSTPSDFANVTDVSRIVVLVNIE